MADTSTIIVSVITLLGGSGFLAGVVALIKLRPEAGQITVTAAQGAVIVQSGVIKDLRDELKRINDELIEEKKENADLRKRLSAFEQKLHELTTRTSDIEVKQNG